MSQVSCSTSGVAEYKGRPALFINDQPTPSPMVFVQPRYAKDFAGSGLHIHNPNFHVVNWWLGPGKYDFDAVDSYLNAFLEGDPDVLFIPRLPMGYAEAAWWRDVYPDAVSVTRSIETGEVKLRLGQESTHRASSGDFASEVWLGECSRALEAVIRHMESAPYSSHMLGYHIGGGITTEWFAWNTFHHELCEDYSPAMVVRFRNWLKNRYGTVESLRDAWKDTSADFATAVPPDPRRMIGADERYLRTDQYAIDYLQCFSETTVAAVERLTTAAKEASGWKKIVGTFFGYTWPHWNITNPARSGHAALQKVFELPTVDFIISPYHYDNRGPGGYNGPQTLPEAVASRGKLYLHEIDAVTHLSSAPERKSRWMPFIEPPTTPQGSVEILARDWASTAQFRSAYWWMDVTGRGWFDDPTIMKGLDNLREIEYKMFDRDWESRSEVAVVISPESSLRERLLSPLPQWYLSVFRQWSLSKMGAPFDSVLMEDVLSGKAWNYKLFVFPNAYYLTDSDRQMLRERLLEQNASALWFHAPGYLSDSGSGIDRSSELTGIALTESARPGVSILFSKAHDPLLRNIKAGDRYGMACDLPDVESKSMTRQCNILDMPDPVVVSDDPDAVNLGNVQGLDMPGLVVKRSGGRADVFSFAPALPWRFMKNLLIEAGAHVWCRTGDIVYADSRFVGVHASTTAVKTIRFPELCRATNLRTGELLGENVSTLKLKMKRGETMLIGTEPV